MTYRNLLEKKFSTALIIVLPIATIFLPFPSLFVILLLFSLKISIRPSIIVNLSSLMLSLILCNSEIGGDLINYKLLFTEAYNSNSFLKYITSQRKEPLFTCLTWLLAKFTFGNFYVYLFIISFILNKLLFQALINISSVFRFNSSRINAIIIFITFFPMIFHLNGIIIRMNLAIVLMIFGFSRLIEKKSFLNWTLIISPILIHFIAIIPLVIFLLIELKLKPKIILGAFGILLTILYLVPIFQNLVFIDYLIIRLSKSNDFYQNIDAANVRNMVMPNIVFFVTFMLSSINLVNEKKKIMGYSQEFKFSRIFLIYFLLFLVTFIFVPINVLEYRLLLISYFLFPFVFIEFLSSRRKILDYYVLLLPIQIIFFFIYISVRNEPNDYKDLIYLLTSPFY